MKKVILSLLAVFFLMSFSVSARDVFGHISTDEVPELYMNDFSPILTDFYPKVNLPTYVIRNPIELISFFSENGIDEQFFKEGTISQEVLDEICTICKNNDSAFCDLVRDVVAKRDYSQYEVYVLQVGSLYWTVYV